jgi:hypothetical protein
MSAAVEGKADTASLDLEKANDANVAVIDAGDVGIPEFDDPNADPDSAMAGVAGESSCSIIDSFPCSIHFRGRLTLS